MGPDRACEHLKLSFMHMSSKLIDSRRQFLTFGEVLQSVTLIPRSNPDTAGRWRVWVSTSGSADNQPVCVWDRKTEGVRVQPFQSHLCLVLHSTHAAWDVNIRGLASSRSSSSV